LHPQLETFTRELESAEARMPHSQAVASEVERLERWYRLQREQVAAVREADGLPLERVRVTSPFDARLGDNLHARLTLLAPHQHRHRWQAERVLEQLRGAG
jgi:hypothetical protein